MNPTDNCDHISKRHGDVLMRKSLLQSIPRMQQRHSLLLISVLILAFRIKLVEGRGRGHAIAISKAIRD